MCGFEGDWEERNADAIKICISYKDTPAVRNTGDWLMILMDQTSILSLFSADHLSFPSESLDRAQ